MSRLLNGLCYVVAGVAAIVFGLAGESGGSLLGALILGLALMAYGAKILLTRSSYWMNTAVYLLATVAVAAAFGKL